MGHTRLKRIVGLENLLKPTTFQLNGFFYNKGYNTGNLEVNCQVLQMCVQLIVFINTLNILPVSVTQPSSRMTCG